MTRSFSTRLRGRLLFLDEFGDGGADFGAHPLAGHGGQGFQVDPVEEFAVESELQLLILRSVTVAD